MKYQKAIIQFKDILKKNGIEAVNFESLHVVCDPNHYIMEVLGDIPLQEYNVFSEEYDNSLTAPMEDFTYEHRKAIEIIQRDSGHLAAAVAANNYIKAARLSGSIGTASYFLGIFEQKRLKNK